MLKTFLAILVVAAACVAGNPAALSKEWRWKSRIPSVSPYTKDLPFKKVIDSYTPSVRIPGNKTVEGCGPVKPQGRIVGGYETIPHSYPWQVAIFITAEPLNEWFCSGTIISEDWVLSAANCFTRSRIVRMVAGAHNMHIQEDTQRTIFPEYIYIHENFDREYLKNDIALIRLPNPMTWSDAIKPVCLPPRSAGRLATGTIVTPTGWGFPSDSHVGTSHVLLGVDVPVMDTAECRAFYEDKISHRVICTDSTGSKGTCIEDSGGPLNYVDGGLTYIRGITSFVSAEGCQAGAPDGFTRIFDYLDWLETNTGIAIGE